MCKKILDSDKSSLVEEKGLKGTRYFEIETLYVCSELALTAINVLDSKFYKNEKIKLIALLKAYVSNNPPLDWINLFNGAFSTAIFLKYATREDLSTAYLKIKERNTVPGFKFNENSALGKLLKNTEDIFSSPIISKDDIDVIMSDYSPNADAYKNILDKIEEAAKHQTSKEGNLIYVLTIAWIQHFNNDSSVKIPVPPRNIQVINVLNIWKWIEGTLDHDTSKRISDTLDGRCMITQVSTGEGKRY